MPTRKISSLGLKKLLTTAAKTTLSALLVALLLSGCKSEMTVSTLGNASLNTEPTLKSITKTGSQTRALYLTNLDQLPSCSIENEYQLVYVVDAKQFMTCQANEWAIVNLDPATATDSQLIVTTELEPNGTNCASGGVKILTGADNGANGVTTAGDGQLTGTDVSKVN